MAHSQSSHGPEEECERTTSRSLFWPDRSEDGGSIDRQARDGARNVEANRILLEFVVNNESKGRS